MATRVWTVREGLEDAIARLVLLQSDARLAPAEQALCGELDQADRLALNALRSDNTVAGGQRTARAQQIEDKVFALNTVERAHAAELSPLELYAAMDLSTDCAGAIRLGQSSFVSDLGD